ncbi:hypothetical protein SynNOUM97013_02928 [Synechococcus sp. NOUM97013]|nr:hypothetical protein SynNOUM97013_02928 [Synechococcus sp. NOUM97013]
MVAKATIFLSLAGNGDNNDYQLQPKQRVLSQLWTRQCASL